MPPEGSLTSTQFEILQLLWNSQDDLSVAEIWEAIREERDVSRTTILNLVDRLAKRGWLKRRKIDGVYRYCPAIDREETEGKLASEFLEEFFNGSATSLLLSLLGSKRITRAELKRLRAMLDNPESRKS